MKIRTILFILVIYIFTNCSIDKGKLQNVMMPKILEKELIDSIPLDIKDYTTKYFPGQADSLFSLYSCTNNENRGILYKGKPITGSLYIEIIPIDEYFCITRRIPAGKVNLQGYGEYEEFDDWTAVINKDGKVVVPFSTDYDSNNVKIIYRDSAKYINVSSGLSFNNYNAETGEKYTSSTDTATGNLEQEHLD